MNDEGIFWNGKHRKSTFPKHLQSRRKSSIASSIVQSFSQVTTSTAFVKSHQKFNVILFVDEPSEGGSTRAAQFGAALVAVATGLFQSKGL